jgi:hypothetical protein
MTLPLVAIRIYAVTRTLIAAGSTLGTKVGHNLAHGQTEKAAEDAHNDLEYAARSTFGLLAKTGRADAMAWDVVLSAIILGLWTALAEADPMTMFRCTLLPWLKSDEEVAIKRQEHATDNDKKRPQLAQHGQASCIGQEPHTLRAARRRANHRHCRSIRTQAWTSTEAPQKSLREREWICNRTQQEQEPQSW